MKRTRVILLLVLLGLFQVAASQEKPNVIIILTDDQGTIDLNSFGAKDLHTPNIDQLAGRGVKFTQFYAAAPLCSPSRASMLTGMNPHAAGLPGNASSMKGTPGMPSDRVTIAEAMKEAGYTTGHIGKWHLGFTPETMPNGQGFDYSYGHMGGCIDNYSHFFYWNGPNRHDLYENGKEIWEDGAYFPDLMQQKADEFITRSKDKPFFMYYAINLPHYPLQPTAKWREHYRNLPHPRKDYAAFVSTIDERVGHLMNTLDSLKLRENTIVIFQSDHGHSVESRAFGGGGNAGPYRGAKMSLFEGGIRVPAIISYPGSIPENEERKQLALNIDWFPTIMDYVGVEKPELEGKSLRKLIENNTAKTSHKLFRWKQGVSWAIRKGDWKLIGFPQDPTRKASLDPEKDVLFLSNLSTDPGEMTNMAGRYPDKVEELLEDYMQWEYADKEDIPAKREKLPSIAKDATITLAEPPHSKYEARGARSLQDEKLGTRQFNDGFWLGYEGNDLVATIDLGKVQQIERVMIGILQDAPSWIFFPEYVEVAWSGNGKDYSDPVRVEVGALKDKNRKLVKRIRVERENVHGRYIRVLVKNTARCPDWHPGAGRKAWLFVDEITVQ